MHNRSDDETDDNSGREGTVRPESAARPEGAARSTGATQAVGEAAGSRPLHAEDPQNRAAIVYDFDGTLARGNMQEHSFFPGLKIEKSAFWQEVGALKQQHDADEILVYMWRMLEQARARGKSITRVALQSHGASLDFFAGVESWFERINSYADESGLALEHYVISSGNLEIIEGCSIFKRFTHVFASQFIYNGQGEAVWPGVAINYTTKTQFLFRINKGIHNSWDSEAVNKWIPMRARALPFERMIFIGDGDTDIPSMKMVRHQGGTSIAVFDPNAFKEDRAQRRIHKLISEDRAHFVAPADYASGSQLEVIVKGLLGRFALS